MTFPVKAIARPAVLAGQRNGRLDTRILIVIPGQEGGPDALDDRRAETVDQVGKLDVLVALLGQHFMHGGDCEDAVDRMLKRLARVDALGT